MKRICDVFISSILILLLLPLFIVVSVLVYIQLGKPVFFIQNRIGMNEKVIRLFKFRTMTSEKDESGKLLPNEVRLTRLGRILRKSSIDELPSLFNVILGDLSLIGPRPLLVDYLPFYKNKHRKRHDLRPGITGLAQINGRNSTTWERRLNFDIYYIENKSFLLDLKILLLTFFKVISSEGVEGNSDLSIIRLDQDKEYLELNRDD